MGDDGADSDGKVVTATPAGGGLVRRSRPQTGMTVTMSKIMELCACCAEIKASDHDYERFWGRMMARIRSDHPGWVMPASPPARNWLPLNTEIPWFSYTVSFGRGELCSELYVKIPEDVTAGERIMSYLRARSAELEAAYGKRLRYQDPTRCN